MTAKGKTAHYRRSSSCIRFLFIPSILTRRLAYCQQILACFMGSVSALYALYICRSSFVLAAICNSRLFSCSRSSTDNGVIFMRCALACLTSSACAIIAFRRLCALISLQIPTTRQPKNIATE